MTQILTQIQKDLLSLKSDLKFSYYEAFLTSFVIGLAESYFAAFAISKGMNTLQSGLLTSLPLIIAGLLNVIFNVYFKKKTLSAHVQDNVILQVVSLVGLAYFSYLPQLSYELTFTLLLGFFSLYWYAFFSSQPAWNTWISEMISTGQSQDYFSFRTRITQLGVISGLLFGGGLLQLESAAVSPTSIFVLIFALSACAKVIKYDLYQKHHSTESNIEISYTKIKAIFHRNKTFFKNYSLFNTGIYLSAPFIAGYLLRSRNLNYFDFMLVTIALFIGKIATTMAVSTLKKDLNPYKMLVVGAAVAAPLPALWKFCPNIQWMILLQLVSGAAWAMWEMGISLTFFKGVPKSDKQETITLYQSLGILSQVGGTILGAILAKYLFQRNYDQLFILAGAIRFVCSLPFLKNKKSLN